MVVRILSVVEKNDRAWLRGVEYPASYLAGGRILPVPGYDVPGHRLHSMARDTVQLPWGVEAVRRTIDGRAHSSCRGNRSFCLPKLAIVGVDECIAFVMAIRMVAYEVALSHQGTDNLRMRFCVFADSEECALYAVIVERLGDPQCPGISRSVIKSNGDFHSIARAMGRHGAVELRSWLPGEIDRDYREAKTKNEPTLCAES